MITNATIPVDDSRDLIVTGSGLSQVALINNGPNTVYLGNEQVTVETGFPVASGKTFSISPLHGHDKLYAVCATGETATLKMIRHN